MKPMTLITLLFLAGLVFLFAVTAFTANRWVEREYEYRERHHSAVVSTMNQYNASLNPASTGPSVNVTNFLLVLFASTGLFTAVGALIGKDGLNGLLRQLKSILKKPRPVHRPTAVNVHEPLPVNAYPLREQPPAVHALPDYQETQEPSDGIRWV